VPVSVIVSDEPEKHDGADEVENPRSASQGE
jgi:hypothetical protein